MANSQSISQNHCPECGSVNLIEDAATGETICGVCGLVIDEQMIDKGPEWRAYTQDEKASRRRVGRPIDYTIYDKGLSTNIPRGRDASGKPLPLSTRLQMGRLRKWQNRSRVHSSTDRNLVQAMNELSRLSDKVYIPTPIKEQAAVIYRKAVDKGFVRGRSIPTVMAAALYVACRRSGTARSLREIAKVSLGREKDVARCYRLLLRELDLHMPIADPLTYIPKIADQTGVSGATQGIAVHLIREAKKQGYAAGKDPLGLAAAALYLACAMNNEKKTQSEIARAAGITEVTVRNRYKTLEQQLQLRRPE